MEGVRLTSAVGTEASQQLKANVSLYTHRASVDLKDVCAALKHRTNRCQGKSTEIHVQSRWNAIS